MVSEYGMEIDPDKVHKIKDWPIPKTPEDVKQCLGFSGYYRKFVKDFAKICQPLSRLMAVVKTKKHSKEKIPEFWKWGQEEEQAFQTLKDSLSSPPVLGYLDYSRPFELHTTRVFMVLVPYFIKKRTERNR